MSNDTKETKNKIIKALAEHLGVEPEDINGEDSLEQDLHIRLADLSDFLEILNSMGLESDKIDLTKAETVNDLVYALDGEVPSE